MAFLAKLRCGAIPLIRATYEMAPQRAVPRVAVCFGVAATTPYGAKWPGHKREASSISTKQSVNLSSSIASKLSLDGKVTVITGGSRGIGLALVEAMAGLGSDVAILDIMEPQVDIEKLQSQYNTHIKHFKTDVTQKGSLENAFSAATKELGHIDNCVTAAGLALDKPFLEYGWEESRRILDVNVIGSFFSAQLAARQMMEQGNGGSIVMISSMAGHCAMPSQRVSIYGASKAAIRLLGKALGVEMAPQNIRVNTLSPGYITDGINGEFSDLEGIVNRISPMGRIGQRDDLTMAVAYLLSEGASYTTGADIAVTGGLHNGRIEL
ncbi:short-chain dehydrogenase/reductase SDR [Histoplasma capsulatum var. duboisii H88]|uniref:Short-chain dehydrogenase/reductase SDR n=1 Tax=Ajellomyces capsulatus (strain H88) TaxID=544711 RepID=F0U619_AJEC8|nr:short-chain dehydrogenase/reductase SDR [Histoplasma capsulatum var. duboisii H88]